jgi:hypothetical protein
MRIRNPAFSVHKKPKIHLVNTKGYRKQGGRSGSALFSEAGSGSGTALAKKFWSNDIVFYSRFLYLQYVLKKIIISIETDTDPQH